jgi:hypothetical protein
LAAVNYTKLVNGEVSPSGMVATLVSGTGSRTLWPMDMFRRIQAMFHRQFAAICVHFWELSWWLDRNHLLIQHKLCIYTLNMRSVKTQQRVCGVVSHCNIHQYVPNNYMFRPCTYYTYWMYITLWYHLTYCLLCFDGTYI